MNKINELTEQIIGAAIEVHREKGPGLLESAYEKCRAHELALRGMSCARQVDVPCTGSTDSTAFSSTSTVPCTLKPDRLPYDHA